MKKLQKGSRYEEYDEDGDGIVSDKELSHVKEIKATVDELRNCLLYTSPSPRDRTRSRMPSSA